METRVRRSAACCTVTVVGTRFFVDETKAKGYVVVAVACPEESIAIARREVGRLILPGQRSVHMKNEGDRRRRQIVGSITGLRAVGVMAVVLDAGRGPEPEHERRDRALRAVVGIASERVPASLVIDLDHTLLARDSRTIAVSAGTLPIAYSHMPLASEPLLTLPDVVAWCWARQGDWRRRIAPLIAEVRSV